MNRPRVLCIPHGERPLMHIYGIIMKKDNYVAARYMRAVKCMAHAYAGWRAAHGDGSREWKFAVNVGDESEADRVWCLLCEHMSADLLPDVVLWR